jgi:hypothetical protein
MEKSKRKLVFNNDNDVWLYVATKYTKEFKNKRISDSKLNDIITNKYDKIINDNEIKGYSIFKNTIIIIKGV